MLASPCVFRFSKIFLCILLFVFRLHTAHTLCQTIRRVDVVYSCAAAHSLKYECKQPPRWWSPVVAYISREIQRHGTDDLSVLFLFIKFVPRTNVLYSAYVWCFFLLHFNKLGTQNQFRNRKPNRPVTILWPISAQQNTHAIRFGNCILG